MEIVEKNLKITIKTSYLLNQNIAINDFFTYKNIRNTIVENLIKQSINYKSFKITNIIYYLETFLIDIQINIYNFLIYKFDNIHDAHLFYLYIKNDTLISNNYSLYFINNVFYFIINNNLKDNLKILDFDAFNCSPLFLSKIAENGIKIIL